MDKRRNSRIVLASYCAAVVIHILGLIALVLLEKSGLTMLSGPDDQTRTADLQPIQMDLILVEVPNAEMEKPDDETPFYSDRDSRAESETVEPEADNIAPIDGEQTETLRLEDVDLVESLMAQTSPETADQDQSSPPAESGSPSTSQNASPTPANPDSSQQPTAEQTAENDNTQNTGDPSPNPRNNNAPPPPFEIKSPDLPVSSVTDLPVEKVDPDDTQLRPVPTPTPTPERDRQWEALFGTSDGETEPEEPSRIQPTEQNYQEPSPQPQGRPRSLAEARKRNQIIGEKTLVESTARKIGMVGMIDSLNRSFGDYDLRMTVAIQNAWYKIVGNLVIGEIDRGQVIIKFRLLENGSIEPTRVHQSSVGLLLTASCQEAIETAAPFGKWPKKMKEEIASPFREITFTFNYL
jgi:hypothetical protein